MNSGRLTVGLTLAVLALGVTPLRSEAQGTLQYRVLFEGPPSITPTSAILVTYYYEQGMEFRPIGGTEWFGRRGGAREGFAYNGTAYLQAPFLGSLAMNASGGGRFGLVSVDLAEYSTLFQEPLTVPFIGYRLDGSTVTTEFTTDGVIDGTGPLADFQTFYFGSSFADLVRVEIPSYGWSLDNMVFSQVPEPTTIALLLVGGLMLWTPRAGFRLRAFGCRGRRASLGLNGPAPEGCVN